VPEIIVPEIVRLGSLRELSTDPWTVQPDGSQAYVGDLIGSSDLVAEDHLPRVQLNASVKIDTRPRLNPRAMRPYQEECVNAVFDAWNAGKSAPLIVLPTGAGKSVISAEIIRRFHERYPSHRTRTWFLAHRKKLLTQMYSHVKTIAPELTCGIVMGRDNDVGKGVTLGSVDTLVNKARFRDATHGVNARLSSLAAVPPRLIIIDECHHATSPKYKSVIERLRQEMPSCLFLGMTATPGRTDGTALDSVFDAVAYQTTIFQLLEDGWLVPPVGFNVNLNVDLNVVPTGDGDFKAAPLSKVMNHGPVREAVVQGYVQYGENRKMIAFCVDVAHARDLAASFRDFGILAEHVDGSMKEKDADAVLSSFADGKIRILTSCDMLTEGYDDPSAQGVIFARPTTSQVVYIQAIGRGLRLHPSKRDCLVLDCVGNSTKHKLAQLANLAGLVEATGLPAGKKGPSFEPDMEEAESGGIYASRIDFRTMRERASRWSWRETRFGWAVTIPRVAFFLLSWTANERRLVDVKFHDIREGRRNDLPIVLATSMEFDLAYGLVEHEISRLFSAKSAKNRMKDKEADDGEDSMRAILEAGITDELFSPEEMMRNDAGWRERKTSDRQRRALIDAGVKENAVPETAGEAADLFMVMTIERDATMRAPITDKQKHMLLRNKLATPEQIQTMTKRAAGALIVKFIAAQKAKRAGAQDEDR
jgi:superfamily II DNA or RNA helicase